MPHRRGAVRDSALRTGGSAIWASSMVAVSSDRNPDGKEYARLARGIADNLQDNFGSESVDASYFGGVSGETFAGVHAPSARRRFFTQSLGHSVKGITLYQLATCRLLTGGPWDVAILRIFFRE